tara:strand:+ start:162 stop:611 length:450 start_codon:yes stop_codon:yes gene_type:complete
MKITRRQLRKIIREERALIERDSGGVVSRIKSFVNPEGVSLRDQRHPALNAIIDAVNDAIGKVPRAKLRDLLWSLNADFARTGKIKEIKRLSERGTGNPALVEIESQLRRTMAEYIDTYMMSMNMNPGDPSDRRRVYQRIESFASALME